MKKISYIISILFLTCFFFGCSTATKPAATAPSSQAEQGQKQETPEKPVPPKITGTLKVHFLDVGQADCILVQAPGGKTMLVDAGNNADSDTVIAYLQNQGIKKIDIIIGTHPHEDHIGGLDAVIKQFDIGSVYLPKVSNTTKTFEDVLLAVKAKGLKIKQAKSGITLDLGTDIKARMLAPNSGSYEDLNNYSAVIKLTFGRTSFLLEGDAEDVSEEEMLAAGYDLKADVLKVGHHGSSSSTSSPFLKAVAPAYAVISVGQDNTYGHPHQETLNKLAAAKITVYRTDLSGTIVAASDGKAIKFNTDPSPITKANPPPAATPEKKVAAVVPVKSGSGNPVVYITKSGAKYHLGGCSSLSKSKIPIKLSEAKAQGYGPCKQCQPPQ